MNLVIRRDRLLTLTYGVKEGTVADMKVTSGHCAAAWNKGCLLRLFIDFPVTIQPNHNLTSSTDKGGIESRLLYHIPKR